MGRILLGELLLHAANAHQLIGAGQRRTQRFLA